MSVLLTIVRRIWLWDNEGSNDQGDYDNNYYDDALKKCCLY
jgi:hypothetical protein